ncbi:methyl-accepting chemotaxis protein [Ureibacillus composti]|nr:methyl-accepting chemotaxis protein [Ureibacillus composti]
MRFSRYIKVKDRLIMLMIVCIISNIILAIFSIDYLRKMENNTELMYEQRLLAVNAISEIEHAVEVGDQAKVGELHKSLSKYEFDSKMEFFLDQVDAVIEKGSEEEFYTLTSEIKQYIIDRADAQLNAYHEDISFGYKLLIGVSLIMIAVVIYFSVVAARSVNVPTRQLKKLLKLAQQGDFTKTANYDAKNEIGEVILSFNQMATEVKELLKTVQESASSVEQSNAQLQLASEKTTEASIHISNDAKDLTTATERSTEQINLNAASIQEIASGVELIASHIDNIEQNIKQSVADANDGVHFVNVNLEQMKEIEEGVKQTNDRMQVLARHSKEIEQVIQIINTIAGQTNLLALNAAIEAARAGEAGKGFSVVAGEVRKLAEQSVQSTKVIEEIIKKIQNDTVESMLFMEKAMHSVQNGIDSTNQTAAKFQQIVSDVNEIEPHIVEVSDTVNLIKENTNEVANNSVQLSKASEQNSQRIHQVSTSTAEQQEATRAMYNEIQKITRNIRTLSHAIQRFTV